MSPNKKDLGSKGGVLTNSDNGLDSQVEPLELLIVSDQKEYRNAGENYFKPQVTSDGSTLFNVAIVTKNELSKSLMPVNGDVDKRSTTLKYKANVVFFDLSDGPITDKLHLPLLDRFLSRNKGCYAIASVKDFPQLQELLKNNEWRNLQRDVQRDGKDTGLKLTESYRFEITGRKLGLDDYISYFDCVTTELLTDSVLSLIAELKSDSEMDVIKRIVPYPTEFLEFSKSMREGFGSSKLVKRSLDIIAGFEPDDTLSMLEELRPSDETDYSVPQHCYPPFGELTTLSQEEVIPLILNQGANPLSFYVHIPFCAFLCTYCDYTTMKGADRNTQRRYLDILKKEMDTIYRLTGWQTLSPRGTQIGGGTPTVLSPDVIRDLGKLLRQFLFFPQENFQLTFEASPATITREKLDAFKDIGANRASLGMQCVADEVLLSWFDRIYNTKRGRKAVELLLERWPDSTNIDMMYGLPGQTMDSWEKDLNAALELGVPSITFYDLRVSPRTKFIKGQEFPKTYERMLMFVMAMEKFLEAGYVQSSDNQVVRSIKGQPYVYKEAKKRGGNTLGIGLSSYSIFPGLIYFNISGRDNKDPNNLENYSRAVEKGKLPIEVGRILDEKEQMRLFTTQGLKLSGIIKADSGVDMAEFENRFGQTIDKAFPHTNILLEKGLLEIKDNFLGLTYKGLAFEQPAIKTYWR